MRCTRFALFFQPICLSLVIVYVANVMPAATKVDPGTKRIAGILKVLKTQMGISNPTQVEIVERNPIGVSVEPWNRRTDFLLKIDARLLGLLDEEELTAALAHELGHIWIYTHHPFLHTEALANEIAMCAVTRDSLKKLYVKLWIFQGTTGNVEEILGAGYSAAIASRSPR